MNKKSTKNLSDASYCNMTGQLIGLYQLTNHSACRGLAAWLCQQAAQVKECFQNNLNFLAHVSFQLQKLYKQLTHHFVYQKWGGGRIVKFIMAF
jgi:iron-sulfur cluster repair protein YtfE (RIC family)